MQKLFFHGRLLIAQREHNRRVYDLPERILPRAILEQTPPSVAETARWSALLKLRQRRLVTLKRDELPLVEDRVQPIAVPDTPILYCLREDVRLLDDVAEHVGAAPGTESPLLLAPLDPLIYDRTVTSRLWRFDYTWEVYTPPAKRKRGYYALPILTGTELVGHVDAKANRITRRLEIASRKVRRGHRVAAAIKQLAVFLQLKR